MERLAPGVFVLSLAAQCVTVAAIGRTYVLSGMQDASIYLEAAHNLWVEGQYVSHLSSLYPPGYSVLIAPTMALHDPARLFAAIYVVNTLVCGGAALMAWPMLRDAVGRRGAWIALALLIWLPSLWTHHLVPQSENLYSAGLLALTGTLYLAFRDERAWAWLLTGALLGLCFATRRFTLVPMVAVALTLGAAEVGTETARFQPRRLARRSMLIAAGALVGFAPEWPYLVAHGGLVSPYKSGGAGHVSLLLSALESPRHALFFAQTLVRQLTYLHLAALGAGVVLCCRALRGWRAGEATPGDRAHTAVMTFGLLTAVGTVVLTAAHMMSTFDWKQPVHLYSRYLDPVAAPMMLVAVAGIRPGRRLPWVPMIGATALCAAAIPIWKLRGPRLTYFVEALKPDHADLASVAAILAAVAAGLLATLLMRRSAYHGVAPLLAAALVGGVLTVPFVLNELEQERLRQVNQHPIFDAPAFAERPDATLGFLDVPRITRTRRNAVFMFRTPNPWAFVEPDQVDAFFSDHPDGLLIGPRRGPIDAPRLHRTGKWVLYGLAP